VFARGAYSWVQPVNDGLAGLSPLGLVVRALLRRLGPGPPMSWFLSELPSMVGLQVGGASLMLLLAIRRLRPTFRRQEETPARRTWFSARNRWRPRSRWFTVPACGRDAVLWKERYFAPADVFTKMVLLPAIIIVTLPLALVTEVEGRLSQVLS